MVFRTSFYRSLYFCFFSSYFFMEKDGDRTHTFPCLQQVLFHSVFYIGLLLLYHHCKVSTRLLKPLVGANRRSRAVKIDYVMAGRLGTAQSIEDSESIWSRVAMETASDGRSRTGHAFTTCSQQLIVLPPPTACRNESVPWTQFSE